MTTTDKRVVRVTRGDYAVLFARRRPIVVAIAPGDVLEFREKGRRQVFTFPIDEAFRLAVKAGAGFRICLVPDRTHKRKA